MLGISVEQLCFSCYNEIAIVLGAQKAGGRCIWIAGGVGKGADFTAFSEVVEAHVDSVILLGADRDLIAKAISTEIPLHFSNTLDDAVSYAFKNALPGDTVLFSPACASFDMYKNFAERGDAFEALVNQL